MTRQLTTREELAAVTVRRNQIAEWFGRALTEDLLLAQRQDILLDRLTEQTAADQPDRMT